MARYVHRDSGDPGRDFPSVFPSGSHARLVFLSRSIRDNNHGAEKQEIPARIEIRPVSVVRAVDTYYRFLRPAVSHGRHLGTIPLRPPRSAVDLIRLDLAVAGVRTSTCA